MITATDTATRFLDWLHDGCEGSIEIRTFENGKPGPRTFTEDHTEAARFGTELDGRADVYYGVATRKPGSRSGTKADLLHAPALWCDLDFKDFAGGRDEAMQRVEAFRPKPSGTVLSGGGVHPYWRLREPLNMQEPEDLALLENLNRRIASALGGDMNACDAARILRLPGTRNMKPDRGGARCIVDTMNGVTYNPCDFDHLPELPAAGANGKPLAAPVGDVIPDGARDTTLMSLAGTMWRRGMSEDSILAALRAENAIKCRPPLPDAALARIARSIAKYPPAEAAGAPAAGSSSTGPRIEAVQIASFLDQPDEPLQEHLEGRLAVFERCPIAGPPKAGKSNIARALALSLATGEPWAGLPIRFTPTACLWLDLEEGPTHLRRSFRRLAWGLDLDEAALKRAPLYCATTTGFNLLERLEELAGLIRGEGIGALFIDTMRRAIPPGQYSEKDPEYSKQISIAMDYLRGQHGGGLAVFPLAHVTKARKANAPIWTAIAGSGDLAAAVDRIWELQGQVDRGATLRVLPRHGVQPENLTLRLEDDGPALKLVQVDAKHTSETCAGILEDVLKGVGRAGIGYEALRDELVTRGLKKNQAEETVRAGIKAGIAVKRKAGRRMLYYAPGMAPAEALEGAS